MEQRESSTMYLVLYTFVGCFAISYAQYSSISNCNEKLVKFANDDQLSASSSWNPELLHGPHRARLDTERTSTPDGDLRGAWVAGQGQTTGQWIMVSLDSTYSISGVEVQGRADYGNQRTERFSISYSTDGTNFQEYRGNNVDKVIFDGNTDRTTKVFHAMSKRFKAKYVRLNVEEYNEHPSIRFEVYGCIPDVDFTEAVDVAFVLDTTAVSQSDFEQQRQFIKNVIRDVSINDGSHRIAVIRQGIRKGDDFFLSFDLNTHTKESDYLTAMDALTYSSDNRVPTDLYSGFRKASDVLSYNPYGSVLVYMANGYPKENVGLEIDEAARLKSQGVKIVFFSFEANDEIRRDLRPRAIELASPNYQVSAPDFSFLTADDFRQQLVSNLARQDACVEVDCGLGSCVNYFDEYRCDCSTSSRGSYGIACEHVTDDVTRSSGNIAFLLDCSSSIGINNFGRVKKLIDGIVGDVAVWFENENLERYSFALVSFNSFARVEFSFNDFGYNTSLIRKAIMRVGYRGGSTNVYQALNLTRTQVFTNSGSRAKPNIAILLTDGNVKIRSLAETRNVAERLRVERDVFISAVGMGEEGISFDTLRQLVSYPVRDNVKLDINFGYLLPVKDWLLQIIIDVESSCTSSNTCAGECVEEIRGSSCRCLSPDQSNKSGKDCDKRCNAVDLAFAFDGSNEIRYEKDFLLQLEFATELMQEFPFYEGSREGRSRVAVARYDNDVTFKWDLTEYTGKSTILNVMQTIPWQKQSTNMVAALEALVNFYGGGKDQSDADNVVIFLTDGHSKIGTELQLLNRATQLKSEATIYVIGVGPEAEDGLDGVKTNELNIIATDSSYVFRIDDWSDLPSTIVDIRNKQCNI
ncbi:unnamed protein product [Owenia fusiformis]|uniref:Uncharacterized protein n=1 Tax=Owenia fusiformis TaxID=6347 RepID=A0A8J1Y3V0_OWEFU|nr:unnamed protein product [Owenia fusiformis]